MKEQGTITKILSSDLAEVSFGASEACKGCSACSKGAEGNMVLEVINKLGAQKGDRVEVEIPTGQVLQASFVIYLLPIIFLILGYLIGIYLSRKEAFGIASALLFLAMSFLAVKWYDKHIQQKHLGRGRVVRIIR